MRIIVDQLVLKDQKANKNIMSLIVHNHINSLNVIYEKNVRVKDGRQLRSHIDVFGPPIKNIRSFSTAGFPQNDVFKCKHQLFGVILIATHIPNDTIKIVTFTQFFKTA